MTETNLAPVAAAKLPAQAVDTLSPLAGVTAFGEAVKMAKFLATSELIPAAFRGKPENIVIALELAHRINASAMAVMQSMYVVHGKPGFSAAFLIGTLNATRRFSPLKFALEGEGDSRSCYAYAKDLGDGSVVTGPRVSIAMAKAEGWYARNGSKWKTMADLMLCYRAGTLFVRLFAPEISLGIRTDDELVDIGPEAITAQAIPLSPEDFGVVARSDAGKAPPASTLIVDDDGRTVDTQTGEVIDNSGDTDGDAQGAQDGAQGAAAVKSADAPAAAAEARPAKAAAATEPKTRQGPTPKADPAPASAELPEGNDDGEEPIGDLSPGMQRTLLRRCHEGRVTWKQVQKGIGLPINKANMNDALGWIDANGQE